MTLIQDLLNQEALLANSGQDRSPQRYEIHTAIRLARGSQEPVCFGADDCSTQILSCCPWRMDCGAESFGAII